MTYLDPPDIAKVFTTYQTFLYFCRNLNMFIKKKLKYFTRPKQISPDLSGVSGDFRIIWPPPPLKNCPPFHKKTYGSMSHDVIFWPHIFFLK